MKIKLLSAKIRIVRNYLNTLISISAFLLTMVTFAQSSDVSVMLTPVASPACGHDTVSITVDVANAGPDTAFNYVLSVTVGGINIPGSPMIIPSINPGANPNFVFDYDFPDAGTQLLVATATAGTPADTIPANNTDSQLLTVKFKGIYTIGSLPSDDFSTIKMAVDSLNTYGICGTTIFDVEGGHTEINSNITINATGNNNDTIIFRNAGLPHPVIMSNVAGSGVTSTGSVGANGDAFIRISGGDYIIFDGIDVQEQYMGGTSALRMEYGYMINRQSITDGARNVIIRNCNISLNKDCQYSVGIYQTNMNNGGAVSEPSDSSGLHINNQYYSNNINNVYSGIRITGGNNTSLFDYNTKVGESGGNIITNFGSGGTQLVAGIYAIYQNFLTIANDSIVGGNGTIVSLYGIFTSSGSNANIEITGNTISLTSNSATSALYGIKNDMGSSGTNNLIKISNNNVTLSYPAATSGSTWGINNTSISKNLEITGNVIHDITTPGTGNITGIEGGSAETQDISGNEVYNLEKTSDGAIYAIRNSGTNFYIHENEIHDLTSNTGSNVIYGISNTGTPSNEWYYENDIYNLTHLGSGIVSGMYFSTANGTRNCYNNNISTLYSEDGSVYGMYHSKSSPRIFGNEIYDLQTNTTSGAKNVYGIYHNTGGSSYIYNNFISDLRSPLSKAVNGLSGIIINNTTPDTIRIAYNTIYLDANSAGIDFGTAGIYVKTTPIIELKNNIINNNSSSVGSGLTVAYFRSSTTLNSYLSSSNNNCFYAGVPSTRNYIFTDGVNTDITFNDYLNRVTPRDNSSFTESTPFLNTSVTPYDLHINPAIPTYCESGGIMVTAPVHISIDIDSLIRFGEPGYTGTGTANDVGADEGDYLALEYDLEVIEIDNPDVLTCYSTSETISAILTNQGRLEVDFSLTPINVSAIADNGSIQFFNVLIDNGTLLPDSSIQVIITNSLDMLQTSTYYITVYHDWIFDQIIMNDTLIIERFSNNPTLDSITTLNNTVCMRESTQIYSYATAYGGGTGTVNFQRDTVSNIDDPGTITSYITVSGAGGQANEIVSVTIDSLIHPNDADLDIYLYAPDGSFVELSTDNGTTGDNYIATVFSKNAFTPIITAPAPFTGPFLPEGNLNDFTGGANGTWRLLIRDDFAGNAGTLYKWSITLKAPNNIATYAWTPGSGLNDSTTANPVATPANTTMYHLIATDENGCSTLVDSIEIFVNPTYVDSNLYEICYGDSILLGGDFQTTAGYYHDSLNTIFGCDSVIISQLVINPVYLDTITYSRCLGDSLFAGGIWRYSSGIFVDSLLTIKSCDSVVYSDLTVYPTYTDTVLASICFTDSIYLGGDYQTTSGFYQEVYPTINGCDSTIVTDLTVLPLPVFNLGNDTTICENGFLDLIIPVPGTYLWSDSSTGSTLQIDSTKFSIGAQFVWANANDGCQYRDTIIVTLDPCTGIDETTNSNVLSLLIYPNPASDKLYVQPSIFDKDLIVRILSTEGRVLLTGKASELDSNESMLEINLSDFAPGMYLINISNNMHNVTEKFFKL